MTLESKKCKTGRRYRATVYYEGARHRSPWFKRKIDAALWEEKLQSGYQLGAIPIFLEASEE